MAAAFEKMIYKQDLAKTRILLVAAGASSFIFYYLMTAISPNHIDWLLGRILITAITFSTFFLTYLIKDIPLTFLRIVANVTVLIFLVLYAYLIHLNDWSVFYRWSYFVVLAVVLTSLLTWKDYVTLAVIGFLMPIVAGLTSPLSQIELWHFHLANLATLVVIGVSIRANFRYRQESMDLTLKLIDHSKMLALGEMSSGISHELNNPLTILLSSVTFVESMIEKNNVDQEKSIKYLEKISSSGRRIASIVQSLRHFSMSDDTEEFANHDLRDILNETVGLYHEKLKSQGISLHYETSEAAQICLCKKFQIMQIIVNLLNNAVDATSRSNLKVIKIQFDEIQNQKLISISIIDSGPGVDPEIENKIMQPFFTTKEVGKGTGLGLSVSFALPVHTKDDFI